MDNLFEKKVPFYYKTEESRLILGDSFKILAKMKPESVDVIFADPPYFLSNDGITCKGGNMVSVNKGEWDKIGSGEATSTQEKHKFNRKWISLCKKVLKPNLGCRCFTHSTETILWARKDEKKARHFFNYLKMKEINDGKQMKDVWCGSLTRKREKVEGKHPTQKPEYILERILLASAEEGYVILDPFCGSGTTGVEAIRQGCQFVGIDKVEGFSFVWITDGQGWRGAKGNLRETFEVMEHVYNIDDLEQEIMKEIFI